MKEREIYHIIIAIMILAIISGFSKAIESNYKFLGTVIFFSALIIIINIAGKKLMASFLDANVEHEIWQFKRYGLRPSAYFKKPIPAGFIFPMILSVLSLGVITLMTILTFETTALKRRAARRFGTFSYTEMTDFHNALIGAAGIVSVLIIAFISYFITGFGELAKLSAFYAFSNMIPFSKLDGSQIFFGSRVLYATLAVITIIFTAYAIFLI